MLGTVEQQSWTLFGKQQRTFILFASVWVRRIDVLVVWFSDRRWKTWVVTPRLVPDQASVASFPCWSQRANRDEVEACKISWGQAWEAVSYCLHSTSAKASRNQPIFKRMGGGGGRKEKKTKTSLLNEKSCKLHGKAHKSREGWRMGAIFATRHKQHGLINWDGLKAPLSSIKPHTDFFLTSLSLEHLL